MEVDPPTYSVVLRDAGPRRLEVMKLIRALRPEVDLAEAKALVETPGQAILPDVGRHDLDRVCRRLTSTWATFDVVRNSD